MSDIEQFASERRVSPDPLIEASWKRCLDQHRLNPEAPEFETVVLRERVRDSIEKLGPLFATCRSQVEHIFNSIVSSGHAVILTDSQGTIIDFLVEHLLEDKFQRHGLVRGADWSESCEGTNGIGTALLEKRSLTVYRNQHFLSSNGSLTCTGAPVFDVNGDVLALFDVSSVGRQDDPDIIAHTRAMLEMSARLISRRNFQDSFADQWIVRFHHNPERIGMPEEGMLAVDEGGVILAADNQALSHLRINDRDNLVNKRIDAIFGKDFSRIVDQQGHLPTSLTPDVPANKDFRESFSARLIKPTERSRSKIVNRKRHIRRKDPLDFDLDGIAGNDQYMKKLIEKAHKLAQHDVPLLITGETGVGKEVLAKALHYASPRAEKPFVAINCAALPAGLIEGELFGYRAGAFTGAHPEGFKGRFLQANGGTLFLDEIGDMPLEIQTRLLRVLETRSVTPLGSEKSFNLDLQIISATHQDLQSRQSNGLFRSDLYYRLAGFDFRLPKLKERKDLDFLVGVLQPGLNFYDDCSFTDQAREAMISYDWPGNIRELKNVLSAAIILSDREPIDVEHLRLHFNHQASEAAPLDMSDREKETIVAALEQSKWNVSRCAEILQISRNTLYRKIRKHGISRN